MDQNLLYKKLGSSPYISCVNSYTCNSKCSRSQGEITFMNSLNSSYLISEYTVMNSLPSTSCKSDSRRSQSSASPRLRGSEYGAR